MSTTIYGFIEEMDFGPEPTQRLVREHNDSVIDSIPLVDAWPPVSREMFGICRNTNWPAEGPDLAYGGRIIHFAANTKSIEYDWGEWKIKFEQLLKKLLWTEARVHFKTEYAELQSFECRVDLLRYPKNDRINLPLPITETHWLFSGDDWPEKM